MNSLLTHMGLLPPLPDFLLLVMHWFWVLKKWCLNVNQCSNPQDISKQVLEEVSIGSLKVYLFLLQSYLFLPCKKPDSTISWLLHLRLLQAFTFPFSPSLFVRTSSVVHLSSLAPPLPVPENYLPCSANLMHSVSGSVIFSELVLPIVRLHLAFCRRPHQLLPPNHEACSKHPEWHHLY